jgi:hypothetical protein
MKIAGLERRRPSAEARKAEKAARRGFWLLVLRYWLMGKERDPRSAAGPEEIALAIVGCVLPVAQRGPPWRGAVGDFQHIMLRRIFRLHRPLFRPLLKVLDFSEKI